MHNLAPLAPALTGIAVIFLAVAFQNYLKDDGKLTSARRTWLRLAMIFSGVGIASHLLQQFL